MKDYSISEINGKLSIESSKSVESFSYDIGKPRLPGYPLRILIPKDSNNIKVDIKYEKELVFSNVKVKDNKKIIDTTGWSPGVYVVRVDCEEGAFSGKIIVN